MPSSWVPVEPRRERAGVRSVAGHTRANQEGRSGSSREDRFVPRRPVRTFDDLILPASTLREIEDALGLIRHWETLLSWGLRKLDPGGAGLALDLYGPPGTGKTHAAEAIASRLGAPIIDVSYAELESKYVGETGQNIAEAFRKAREARAVLFFDEADSVLSKRVVEIRQSADYGVNQARSVTLKQLDAFDGLVIFATNFQRNYDRAFVRRILAHVRFELPDQECRERLWRRDLLPETPGASELDPVELARESEGLSGAEILNVVKRAWCKAVQRTGADRRLREDDLLGSMLQERRAKAEVGSEVEPGTRVETRRVPVADLPGGLRRELAIREGDVQAGDETEWEPPQGPMAVETPTASLSDNNSL